MFQSPAAKSTTLKSMLSKANIQALENEARRQKIAFYIVA